MKVALAALALLVSLSATYASWRDDIRLRGYVRETPILWKPSPVYFASHSRRFDNLLHTRQSLRVFPAPSLQVGAELKTRLFTGKSAQDMKRQTDVVSLVLPYFRWTRNIVDEKHTVLTSTLDRAWLDWTTGTVEWTVGRQRVAWGTNFVWNPTDIFNPASPLDFDNEEKSGTDAARVEWYLGPNSLVDAAIAPQHEADSTTAAVRLQINHWEYDWIFLGGRRGPVTVAGFAWAGQLRGGGFRGEVLYSMPRKQISFLLPDDRDNITAAVSGDYTFRSSLYLHGEILYNQYGATDKAGSFRLLKSYTEGKLSPARLSLFWEIARDLSPLVRADLMGILNPYDHSWYAGPTVTWSVLTNLDFTAAGLIFGGDAGTEFGDNGEIFMARMKYSF